MGFDDRPDYDHYAAVNKAIADNPGVFGPGEAAQFQAILKTALGNAKDAKGKLKLVNTVESVIQGAVTGGISGGLPGILAGVIGGLI